MAKSGYSQTIATSDENVIPQSAISMEPVYYKTSNVIRGGTLLIDLGKVSLGTCYVEYYFKSGNLSGKNDGTVVFKVEIKEFGTIEYDTYHVDFDLDFSKVATEITNGTFIVSQPESPYGCLALSDKGNGTAEFQTILDDDNHLKVSVDVLPDTETFIYGMIPSAGDTGSFRYLSFPENEAVTEAYRKKWSQDSLSFWFYQDNVSVSLTVNALSR